jgi:excisionase family DNA binding protein
MSMSRGSPGGSESSPERSVTRLLTVAEVASVMRVSRMTVYRLIRRAQLKAIRVGRNYRVRSADLDEYLESQAVTGQGVT